MKHQFDTGIDHEGTPYLVCRVCGMAFQADDTAEMVEASKCLGRIDWQSFDGIENFGNATITYTVVLGSGKGSGRRTPPEERSLIAKGDELLKQWAEESDE